MAKKTRSNPRSKSQRAAPSGPSGPSAPSTPFVPPTEPRFWFGFEISWTKLLVGRFVVFGLLALDALLAIRHAPRYGAGNFNVAQISWLDGLGPTRSSYLVCELLNAFLFTFAALGLGTRIVVPIAAALYAWLYLGSQLDSYQHHYLVALILALAAAVPWERPKAAVPSTKIASWALRLILVQLAILYLYAAISKFDPAWLDGRTLGGQIMANPDALVDVRHLIDRTIGMRAMAHVVVLIELSLALVVWIPRAWIVAAPLGILFHLGIVFSGLEIGLFAWLMIGLYIFIIPDRLWIALGESSIGRGLGAALAKLRSIDGNGIAAVVATLAGLALAFLARIDHAFTVALAIFIVPYIIAVATDRGALLGRIGVAQLVAFALWFAVDRGSTVTGDYFKFWGGSSRRLGDVASAERAYRKLVEVSPDDPSGHYQLARLLLAREDELDGMAELHAAQELEPKRARAWLDEARYLEAHQRHAAALDAARKGLAAEPGSPDAQSLIATLTGAEATAPGRKKKSSAAAPGQDDE